MIGEPVYDVPDCTDLHPRCTRCDELLDISGNCISCDAQDVIEARRAQAEMDRFGSSPAGMRRWQAHLRRQQRG